MMTSIHEFGRRALLLIPAAIGAIFAIGELTASLMSPIEFAIKAIGPAFCVWALGEGAMLIDRVRSGDHHGPRIVSGLYRSAAAILLAAFSIIVLTPSLIHLLGNSFTAMTGAEFNLGIEGLTLVGVGFLLIFLAKAVSAIDKDVTAIL